MLNHIDEFTHECLAIRVDRKLKAADVLWRIVRSVHSAWRARTHPIRHRTGIRRQGRAAWIGAVGAKSPVKNAGFGAFGAFR